MKNVEEIEEMITELADEYSSLFLKGMALRNEIEEELRGYESESLQSDRQRLGEAIDNLSDSFGELMNIATLIKLMCVMETEKDRFEIYREVHKQKSRKERTIGMVVDLYSPETIAILQPRDSRCKKYTHRVGMYIENAMTVVFHDMLEE